MKPSFFIRGVVIFLFGIYSSLAYALPEGYQVQAGSADFNQPDASTLNINTSDRVIINYNSFSIAQPEAVNFNQPNSSSVALNRVVGLSPSEILGALTATGRIFLVNPNGVLFGPNSHVDVAALVASTLDISNTNFLNGNYTFNKYADKIGASVINQGYIQAKETVLMGSAVKNEGQIVTTLGKTTLASGEKATLSLDTAGMISVAIDEAVKEQVIQDGKEVKAGVENEGEINADGGVVVLTAKALDNVFDYAVNNEGIIQANALDTSNGKVVLKANQNVKVAGEIRAEGGEINVASENDIDVEEPNLLFADSITLFADSDQNGSGDLYGETVLTAYNHNFSGAGDFDVRDNIVYYDGTFTGNLVVPVEGNSLRGLEVISTLGDTAVNSPLSREDYIRLYSAGDLYVFNDLYANSITLFADADGHGDGDLYGDEVDLVANSHALSGAGDFELFVDEIGYVEYIDYYNYSEGEPTFTSALLAPYGSALEDLEITSTAGCIYVEGDIERTGSIDLTAAGDLELNSEYLLADEISLLADADGHGDGDLYGDEVDLVANSHALSGAGDFELFVDEIGYVEYIDYYNYSEGEPTFTSALLAPYGSALEDLEITSTAGCIYVEDTEIVRSGDITLSAGIIGFSGSEILNSGGDLTITGIPTDANHTPSIQSAIDAIGNVGGTSTINVGAGTYNESVVIDKTLTLLGAQANVDPRPSVGGRTGAESIIDAGEVSSYVIRIANASDVEINGFSITGGTGDMVEESGSADNLLFQYNILYDDLASAGDEAIQIKYSYGVTIQNNYAYNIVQDAFNLSESTKGLIAYNEAHDIDSENAAIYCYGATDIDIIGNLIYKVHNNDGIKLGDSDDGSTGGTVSNNTVYNAAQDGITIYASGVTVDNNTIYNCDSENGALYLYGADNTTVTNNEIYDNDAIGLLIKDSDNVDVEGNEIYNNIDTNDTKYPGSAGIWLTSDATSIEIKNANNIYGNLVGIEVEGNILPIVTDNDFADNSDYHVQASDNVDGTILYGIYGYNTFDEAGVITDGSEVVEAPKDYKVIFSHLEDALDNLDWDDNGEPNGNLDLLYTAGVLYLSDIFGSNDINTNGADFIFTNKGDLYIDVGIYTYGGIVDISASSPLTVSAAVTAGGDITLDALETSDAFAYTDDLTINDDITSTGGNIILRAGDDIIQAIGTTVQTSGGTIDIIAAYNDKDSEGSVTQNGTAKVVSGFGAATGGNITLTARDNILLTLLDASGTTTDGNATITSNHGAIVDNDSPTDDNDITANNLILSAVDGIGSGDVLETEVSILTALNTSSNNIEIKNDGTLLAQSVINNGDDVIITVNSDLTLGYVESAGDSILTATTGSIIDDDADNSVDVIADGLAMDADSGIGVGNPIETEVNTLAASAGDGIEIVNSNASGLTVGNVGSLSGITGSDVAIAETAGDITIDDVSITSTSGDVDILSALGSILAYGIGPHIESAVDTYLTAVNGVVGTIAGYPSAGYGPVNVNVGGNLTITAGASTLPFVDGSVTAWNGGAYWPVSSNITGTVSGSTAYTGTYAGDPAANVVLLPATSSFPGALVFNPPGYIFFNAAEIWPDLSAPTGAERFLRLMANWPIQEILALFRVMVNDMATHNGAVFFYHPVTATDSGAFDGFALTADMYEFIDGQLKMKAGEFFSWFEEELKKKKK